MCVDFLGITLARIGMLVNFVFCNLVGLANITKKSDCVMVDYSILIQCSVRKKGCHPGSYIMRRLLS